MCAPACVTQAAQHTLLLAYLVHSGNGEEQKSKQYPVVLEVDVCPAV